jgi:iron(III) transport system substrate-binding protein
VKMSSHRPLAAVVLSLSVAMTGCGTTGGSTGSDADGKGASGGAQSLTIYTGRDLTLVKSVIADFTAAKPEYKDKIHVVTIAAQEALDRLRAEKGNPQAGFLWGGTQQALTQAADEGLLEAYTPKTAGNFPATRRDAKKRWWGEVLLAEVIVYNNKLVKKSDAPKDWDDLVSPAWKGKIVIRDVLVSGTMRTIYSSMIYRFFKTDDTPDAGYEFLKKLDANTANYTATPEDMYLKLARGVGEVTVWNLQDVLIQANRNKQPFSFVMPASGAPVLLDGVGIVKGSKSTKAAQDFMDFLFAPETQAKLAKTQFQIPAVELAADKQPAFLKDLDIKEMDVDFGVLAKHEEEWMAHWQANIKGKG